MLQRYSFLILHHVKQKARADLEERAAVSTTFSTGHGSRSRRKRGRRRSRKCL